MSVKFPEFATAIKRRFVEMSKSELFVVDTDKDLIWSTYIEAFPDGENPMFRERTEHDCSCCKNFIRNVGSLVTIFNGNITTVWDVDAPEPYATVASVMNAYIRSLDIVSVFRTKEANYGADTTRELRDNGTTHVWHHLHGKIANKHQSSDFAAIKGRIGSVAGVFERGLVELGVGDVQTVLDLIDDKLLYRGDEHRAAVSEFRRLQVKYHNTESPRRKHLFIWENISSPAARFRNTVIGTLVQDLSDGVDIQKAVKSFETKVAPMNYKRPTALITPRMIETAVATLKELGLETAIERRFARLSDVSVNNVLFVDNSVQDKMKDGITGLLMEEVKPVTVSIDNTIDISIDAFMGDVLKNLSSIDLLVQNKHAGNFMSLTAPQHATAGDLFKWSNNFAWSYDGDIADSMKQRVKAAGGRIDAKLRVSLGWFNYDDLDIHVHTPSRKHIFFGNKMGNLDVDMNVGPKSREAVENVCWDHPEDGVYKVVINQYCKRESIDVGFDLELDFMGTVYRFSYPKSVSGYVEAIMFKVKNGALVSYEVVDKSITEGSASQDKWGVTTESLVKVNTMMTSPNHWDSQSIGNKHWFFMLDSCVNPDPTRGIYNEFLSSALEPHRKVFEVLGAKTKCPWADEQLSGLGFSSTRGDSAVVVAKGQNINRAYNIKM